MIKLLEEDPEGVFGFEITSKVSLADELAWIKQIEGALEKHDKISVLVILDDKASWGIEAGYEDLKWALTHTTRFNRIAIVSNRSVWEWLVAFNSPFASLIGVGMKHFELSHLDEAWGWVRS